MKGPTTPICWEERQQIMTQNNKKKIIRFIMMLKFTVLYSPLWKHCSLIWRRQLERVRSFVFVERLVPRLLWFPMNTQREVSENKKNVLWVSAGVVYKADTFSDAIASTWPPWRTKPRLILAIRYHCMYKYKTVQVFGSSDNNGKGCVWDNERAEPTGPGSDNPFASLSHLTPSERTATLQYP